MTDHDAEPAPRRLARPLLVAGVAAALAVSFLAGTRVGTGGTRPDALGPDARPAAFRADLDAATSCDELLASYRERGRDLVSAWGWAGPPVVAYGVLDDRAQDRSDSAGVARTVRQTASDTGTNVQETGVDEPDTVKTDGARVVRVRDDELVVHEATDRGMRVVSSLHLPKIDDAELLLSGDTVVAIGADRASVRDDTSRRRRGARVITVSLADPERPAITSDVTYASQVLAVRQHGSVARLVLSSGLPALRFVEPDGTRTSRQQALETNRRAVAASTLADWLPTYDAGDGSRRLVECTDVAVPGDELGLDTVSVVGIELSRPTEPQAIALAGSTPLAYASADHLYLVAGPGDPGPFPAGCAGCRIGDLGDRALPSGGTTHVFDLALDGARARHVASGEIEGSIADRWSLDEADGVLRAAVGPSSETGSFNSVVTMRRDRDRLVEIGRLDKIGRHEQIKGVRWFDDLAVVVTYRQVDPLHTVDLSSPGRPLLIGELKIPGFSDYLHPLDDDRLLGVGVDDAGNAQVALFDTRDLADVSRTDVVGYRRSRAVATTDPRAFTWLPDRSTALVVLRKGRGVDLATITVGKGTLRSTVERVEHGPDAAVVRTIELADGRVALVTGEDVRLLDLP